MNVISTSLSPRARYRSRTTHHPSPIRSIFPHSINDADFASKIQIIYQLIVPKSSRFRECEYWSILPAVNSLPPLALLSRCSDPILLVSDEGEVQWYNEAAAKAFEIEESSVAFPLTSLCSAPTLRTLLTSRPFTFHPLTIAKGKRKGEALAAHVLDISGNSPDEGAYLLYCSHRAPDPALLEKKEESLATVAHDLKNPLSALFGFTDVLLDTPDASRFTPSQRDILLRARDTVGRSIELVKNYEQLFKIGVAGVVRPKIPVDLNTMVEVVVNSLVRESSSQKLILKLSPLPLLLYVEKIYLDRIISNLLANALKFTPPQGTIQIITQDSKQGALFAVNNSGPAIPPETQRQLFQKYTRGHEVSEISGSGLGLYIVKKIVDALQGEVVLESTAEEGTTFSVLFPYKT